ncbi:MAG: hypothetical protein ACE5FJ_05010 [Gemmatimonadales bacterium]
MADQPEASRKPTKYTAEELDLIREQVKVSDAPTCPICGTAVSHTTLAGGASIAAVWELHCDTCGRWALVRDVL